MKINQFLIPLWCIVIAFGAITRWHGNDWDQGNHLHPDERFLTMVANAMEWPITIQEYLNTGESKLNPHNIGFPFYVYGTWPVIFVKYVAESLGKGDYYHLTLIGRLLSGLTDLFICIFIFLIGKRLSFLLYSYVNHSRHIIVGLVAMTLYILMALPIQLSHFFTTDPYVTVFLVVCVYLLLFSPSWKTGALLGVFASLAVSAKISGVLILPIIGVSPLLYLVYKKKLYDKKNAFKYIKKKSIQLFIFYILFSIFFILSFRILMPYLFDSSQIFSFNQKTLDNWRTLNSFDDPNGWFPPAVQWINQPKLIAPLFMIFFIGLGPPLGILITISLIWMVTQLKHAIILLLPFSFIGIIFFYHAMRFAFPLRYFWPMYPMLAIICGLWIESMYHRYAHRRIVLIGLTIIILLLLVWPTAVLLLYARPHSRVTASQWIYENIPEGSAISYEYWDDPLPLHLPESPGSKIYKGVELPMYFPDTEEKWIEIETKLEEIDYVILSSNRVYGSILSAPERYPKTAKFYRDLFSERLPFEKIAEFTSRPSLPLPINLCIPIPWFSYGKINQSHVCQGIEFIDDYVEESWTVYDHPKVTIFKRK